MRAEIRPWSEQDDQQLIAWSEEFVPVAEIAERLGRSYQAVVTRRLTLKRAGRLERLGYDGHAEWTAEEEELLELLLERGYSVETCAAIIGRSANGVKIKYQRAGKRLRVDRRSLTGRDIARIMGIGCSKSVVRWVEMGWLTPLPQDRPDHGTWRFDERCLFDFVVIHEAHMTWDVERITDPELQAHARAIRAAAVRWLRPGEVAHRLGVGIGAVNDWIHRRLLTGIKYGNWWIREDQLAGFVLPCEVPKQKVHRGLVYGCCGRRLPLGSPLATLAKRDRVCDRCTGAHV